MTVTGKDKPVTDINRTATRIERTVTGKIELLQAKFGL